VAIAEAGVAVQGGFPKVAVAVVLPLLFTSWVMLCVCVWNAIHSVEIGVRLFGMAQRELALDYVLLLMLLEVVLVLVGLPPVKIPIRL
jgi:surface polysaccharide O-acyltransferase-like enzyme